MKTSPEVERWFAENKLPAEATMRRVRETILRADRRMIEYVKYGTLCFGYQGDFATFVQVAKKQVSVMFNRGARIPGKFPHLEGTGPSARFMRFADPAEAQARAAELSKIVAAWCSLAPPRPSIRRRGRAISKSSTVSRKRGREISASRPRRRS
jgi:hypothetical protein